MSDKIEERLTVPEPGLYAARLHAALKSLAPLFDYPPTGYSAECAAAAAVLAELEGEAAPPKVKSSLGRPPIHKQDVLMSLANAIMWLGKAEPEHVRWFIDQARRNFEQWLVDRPEKKAAEATGK